MTRDHLLSVLFSIGEQVARLREEVNELSDALRDSEREYLFRSLKLIEAKNAELLMAFPVHHAEH